MFVEALGGTKIGGRKDAKETFLVFSLLINLISVSSVFTSVSDAIRTSKRKKTAKNFAS